MFIGHFGLAFGAKKAAPAVSLGTLFVACQFADLLWPTLVLLGYERVGDRSRARRAMTPLELRQLSRTRTAWWRCACGASRSARSTSSVRRARISAARHARAARRQPLGARLRDAPARHAAHAERRRRASDSGCGTRCPARSRSEFVVFGDRARGVSSRDGARAIASARSACGALVAFLLVVYLAELVRPAAADRGRRRLVGAGDVAARRLGILGRQAPDAAAELAC